MIFLFPATLQSATGLFQISKCLSSFPGGNAWSFSEWIRIIFDFVVASSGFNIVVRGLEQTLSRPNDYIDYSNEAEIESIIKMIEMRIKILDNSQ